MQLLKQHSGWILVLLFFGVGVLTPSCKREQFDNNPSTKLKFSTDTVMFDTVFTILGGGPFPRSVNKRLIVYNPSKSSIKTSIRLAGGSASPYRINIDGERTTQLNDYEILGGDSIYIFVEVSIDPRNGGDPIVRDSIEFITNGNTQYTQLRAFGVDAHYFNKVTSTNDTAWTDVTKPYVIYGYFWIPQNRKLTIGPGVKIYSDVGAGFIIEGTLEVNGTKQDRVVMQGARLGKDFADIPGQWYGLHFITTSRNSTIKYTDIVNGTVGVRSDSLSNNANPKVTIENTLIKNMSAVGVLAFTSKLKLVNTCVVNCGQYTFAGDLGGNYEMIHCTFANYGGTFSRKEESFAISNADYKNQAGTVISINPLTVSIRNSIIYGSLREEFLFVREGQGNVTASFFDNFIKTELLGWDASNTLNKDPKFKNIADLDFSLDTLSPAKDKAPTLGILDDLEGTLRNDGAPDVGAYERTE